MPRDQITILREALTDAAAGDRTVTYQEVGNLIGFSMANDGERYRLAHLLGEISRLEDEHGRPLLSAVVVQKETGRPGTGFFELARERGRTVVDEDEYFVQELQAVYAHWRRRRG